MRIASVVRVPTANATKEELMTTVGQVTTTPEPPTSRDAGREDDWRLPLDDGRFVEFHGRFLGMGSSHQRRHKRHAGDYAETTERCGACRWFEPRIFTV